MTSGRDGRHIEGVLFDFDGTLTAQGALDFAEIRRAVGCPDGVSILSYIEEIEDTNARKAAEEILNEFERAAADRTKPHDGAEDLIARLIDNGLCVGILTRNSRDSVMRSLANFSAVSEAHFMCIITRDDAICVKPAPDGVLHAARVFGISPSKLLMVGDYIYDVEAGKNAGSKTVFLDNHPNRTFEPPEADYTVASLHELHDIIWPGS